MPSTSNYNRAKQKESIIGEPETLQQRKDWLYREKEKQKREVAKRIGKSSSHLRRWLTFSVAYDGDLKIKGEFVTLGAITAALGISVATLDNLIKRDKLGIQIYRSITRYRVCHLADVVKFCKERPTPKKTRKTGPKRKRNALLTYSGGHCETTVLYGARYIMEIFNTGRNWMAGAEAYGLIPETPLREKKTLHRWYTWKMLADLKRLKAHQTSVSAIQAKWELEGLQDIDFVFKGSLS